MKKTTFAFLTIALMAFMAYSLFAQDIAPGGDNMRPVFMGMGRMMMNRGPGRGMGPMGPGPMMAGKGIGMLRPELMEKIGLTKEQKDSIQGILSDHKRDMIKKKAELELANVDLQDMMRKEKPDMDSIKGQMQKIGSLKADIQFAQLKARMDTKNVLTDEQKAKLQKIIQDQRAMMKENIKNTGRDRNVNRPGPMNRQMDNRPMNRPNPGDDQRPR